MFNYLWKLNINENEVTLEGNLKNSKQFKVIANDNGYESDHYPLQVYRDGGYGGEWKAIEEFNLSNIYRKYSKIESLQGLVMDFTIMNKHAIIKVKKDFSFLTVIANKEDIFVPIDFIKRSQDKINIDYLDTKLIDYDNRTFATIRMIENTNDKLELIKDLKLEKVLTWIDGLI